jgi:RNA polymerase sigma-70 factor (ECF subfamily)
MYQVSSEEHGREEFHRQLLELLPRLWRFARGLTRVDAEADDLVQAACERALTRLDQWRPDSRLDSWMFRILQTIWLNELRGRKVRARHLDSEQVHQAETNGENAEKRLLLIRVEDEVHNLPDNLRVVLLLVCVEGLSYREAAEVLSIPIGTIMSRLARARTMIMERLGNSVHQA